MHVLDMPVRYGIWVAGLMAGGLALSFEFNGDDRLGRRYADAVTRLADGVLLDATRAYLTAMPVIQGGGSPESIEALQHRVHTAKDRAKTFSRVRAPGALQGPAEALLAAVSDLVTELEGMDAAGAAVAHRDAEGRDAVVEQEAGSVLLAHGATVKRYTAARSNVAAALKEMGVILPDLPGSTRTPSSMLDRREA